jgi:YjbR
MTPNQFRRLALSFPDTEERAHHHHPDFRVKGKLFATLGYPDASRAMVKLTPEQQAEFVNDCPDVFSPVTGAWGRQGCTSVLLPKATKSMLQPAVVAAVQNGLLAAGKPKKKPPKP